MKEIEKVQKGSRLVAPTLPLRRCKFDGAVIIPSGGYRSGNNFRVSVSHFFDGRQIDPGTYFFVEAFSVNDGDEAFIGVRRWEKPDGVMEIPNGVYEVNHNKQLCFPVPEGVERRYIERKKHYKTFKAQELGFDA